TALTCVGCGRSLPVSLLRWVAIFHTARVGIFFRSQRCSRPRKEPFPMRRTLLVLFTWVILCATGFAQTLGTITGEVKDSTGGLVPGATVTVVNKATNATRTTQTNEVGLFDFPALPPGNYTVKSELEGFKAGSGDLELQVQQTARVNFQLELGTISEQATVTGV